ncbi:MAG: hypothetical protein L6V87_11190 [Ruminococcus sp.]|nr:MAG: hypothetical protein L6V87_11190 [Ruminococcus sp.]
MAPEISGEYAADEAEMPSVAAEMGWDYSTETQSADNYYTLDLAETDSGIYNAPFPQRGGAGVFLWRLRCFLRRTFSSTARCCIPTMRAI